MIVESWNNKKNKKSPIVEETYYCLSKKLGWDSSFPFIQMPTLNQTRQVNECCTKGKKKRKENISPSFSPSLSRMQNSQDDWTSYGFVLTASKPTA